jgi:hypothetical protein
VTGSVSHATCHPASAAAAAAAHHRGAASSFRNAYMYGPGFAQGPRVDPTYGLAVSIGVSWQPHAPNIAELLPLSAMRTRMDRGLPKALGWTHLWPRSRHRSLMADPPPTSASTVFRPRQLTVNPWHRRVWWPGCSRLRHDPRLERGRPPISAIGAGWFCAARALGVIEHVFYFGLWTT